MRETKCCFYISINKKDLLKGITDGFIYRLQKFKNNKYINMKKKISFFITTFFYAVAAAQNVGIGT
ncbi:MAG: hypothetical protein KDC15_12625, partial [Chitinophagaceae bacterium]|nr:hypothetical protein [Chitinophagaceae bacterium]